MQGFGGMMLGQDANPAFAPTNINGCVLWLRADLGITISTGVSEWDDQSGSGDTARNMKQAVGASQPTRNATDAAYNGQSTLSFNGTAQTIYNTSAWSSTASVFTVFLVGNSTDTAGFYIFFSGAAAVANPYYFYSDTTPSYNLDNGSNLNGGVATTAPTIFRCEFGNDPNSGFAISSKSLKATGTVGTSHLLGDAGFGIGTYEVSSDFLKGKVAEVIAYNSILSAANVTLVQNYLGTRYNITIGA